MKPICKLIATTFFVFFISVHVNAWTYYWVGGTGNWTDLNHWATTSGGNIHPGSLPLPVDDVVFDANSFPSAGAVVNINLSTIEVNNFDWTGVTNNPTLRMDTSFISYGVMKVNGSFILDPGMIWEYGRWISGCQIELNSNASGNIIKTAGVQFYGLTTFEIGHSGSGTWSLADDFTQTNSSTFLLISQGTFTTNNFMINVPRMEIWGSNINVDFGTSVINCDLFQVASVNNTVNAGASTINCTENFGVNPIVGNFHVVNAKYISARGVLIDEANASIGIYASDFNTGTTIGALNVGNDTCSSCFVRCQGLKVSNANFRGINFFIINPQGSGFEGHYDIDTLELATPGSTYIFSDSDSVYIHNSFVINSQPGDPVTLKTNSGTAFPVNLFCDMSLVCFDYLQLQNINGVLPTQFYSGANSTDLGGNFNWQFTSCYTPNVWPGDANYDLTANNIDVLYIGLAYGETGPTRPGASNSWVAQPMADWPSAYFFNGVNKKNADCDGNGIVDFADTTAVSINYGFTHPARLANQQSQFNSLNPELKIIATPDSIPPSAHVHADIELGTSAIPVDSIYGLAFTIYYDPTVVNSDSISIDFSNSWLGTVNSDLIGFVKPIGFAGQLDFALCRNDHANIYSGFGHVASVDVVIEDNISTITNSPIRIGNVTALTASEYQLSLNTADDTLFVRPFTSLEDYTSRIPICVYPNPASGKVIIASSASLLTRVELFDLRGNLVFRDDVHATSVLVDVNHIAPGFYNLRCMTERGVYYQKITVE